MSEPDLSDSEFTIGIEVEYPVARSWENRFREGGKKSKTLLHQVQDDGGLPSRFDAGVEDEYLIGLEVVSGQLHLSDAANWYRDLIEYIEDEYNKPYCPSGIITDSNIVTAGLHIHLSPLSYEKAQELFDISRTAWGKALFCSSIVSDDYTTDWRVFRGGKFCQMKFDSGNRYDCLNSRGGDHWEWRMPEPMTPDHFEETIKFLRLFEDNVEDAIEYGHELLDNSDSITSIERAHNVGMDANEGDTIRKQGVPTTADFFEEIESYWDAPEIYTVHYDNTPYYVFDSRLGGPIDVSGVTVSDGTVIRASDLTQVDDSSVRDSVWNFYQSNESNEPRESEATEVVKEVVKKKKQ